MKVGQIEMDWEKHLPVRHKIAKIDLLFHRMNDEEAVKVAAASTSAEMSTSSSEEKPGKAKSKVKTRSSSTLYYPTISSAAKIRPSIKEAKQNVIRSAALSAAASKLTSIGDISLEDGRKIGDMIKNVSSEYEQLYNLVK